MFDMTNDDYRFRERDDLQRHGFELDGAVFRKGTESYLPLYEGKLIHHFDYRWASFVGDGMADVPASAKADPHHVALPRYWVAAEAVAERLEGWQHDWLLAFRGVTQAARKRTLIPAILPRTAVGSSLPLLLAATTPPETACLAASLSSLALDYVTRQ